MSYFPYQALFRGIPTVFEGGALTCVLWHVWQEEGGGSVQVCRGIRHGEDSCWA